jgi:putative protease
MSAREEAMATKTRAKAKRKKTTVGKTARRRKTVRKTRIIRKKAAKKAAPRRAPRTKPKSTAKVAVKPTPVSQRAQPEAGKPPPSRPAQPTAAEQRIGVVTHYYSHLSVVAMALEPGTTLRVGDRIHIHGHTTDFTQKVESLEVDHAPVTEVGPNDDFGLKVVEHAREHDIVYRVRP